MTGFDLFKSMTLTWWQASLFKLAMISAGVAIGATWPSVFRRWTKLLWVVAILLAGYITYVWWLQ